MKRGNANVACSPYLERRIRQFEEARAAISRNEERRLAARSGGVPQTDQQIAALERCLAAFNEAQRLLCQAESHLGFGSLSDEIGGTIDTMSNLRGMIANIKDGRRLQEIRSAPR